MTAKIDLSQLAGDRSHLPPATPRRWRILTRIGLPGLLLAGFAVLLLYAARDLLSPPRSVTVVPVLTLRRSASPQADTPLFRAPGWVEPRPTPTLVTALTEGVVEQLLVVEGQAVVAGEVVARLVDAEASLAVDAAEADLQLRDAELSAARAALEAARVRREQPVHLEAELADAEALLARTQTEVNGLPARLRAAEALHRFARFDFESKQKSNLPEVSIVRARTDLDAAEAAVEELRAKQTSLPAEIAALKAKRTALQVRLDRKTDETRQVAEAEAAVKTAEARLRLARVGRDTARLRLERTQVRAPSTGRVLALVARPGTRLNGLAPGSLHDSSTVVTLYDPAQLQARVDVRLDDVGKVRPGLKVRIDSAALPNTLHGEVLMLTSQADVQKNTLSVKVAVFHPPPGLKPDMLCQVTFLAQPSADPIVPDETERLLVPRQLVETTPDGGRVWVADRLDGVARLRVVKLGANVGDLVEVLAGLSSSDKLIAGSRDGLQEGDRITVDGEDETLGVNVESR